MQHKIVIMAGGSGTRFFPLSKENLPKQFLALFSPRPMILDTFYRVLPLVKPEDVFVSTSLGLKQLSMQTLPRIPAKNFILEPCAKNTGPALGLVCLQMQAMAPGCLAASLHSDHP